MIRRAVRKNSLTDTTPTLVKFPVNDSQTINRGDIVVIDTGKVSIAADAAAAGTVLGVAEEAITTTTATADDVILVDINPDSIYEMEYIGTADPVIGVKYDLGTAAYKFDSDDTTDGYIQVVGNVDTTNKKADVILNNRVFGMA